MVTGTQDSAFGWRFDNTYSRLPDTLFAQAEPAAVRAPKVSILNHKFARELGLDTNALTPELAAAQFAGQDRPTGSFPIAQAYAGHQFGGFTMLGDGRAILLGEHRTPSGKLVDIQFKGTGPTQFSRRGDGRAALGPMLREYIISEAMAALGIPTTRSLAVVTTGNPVFRSTPARGAILTRVAASHIRVGTFEYAVRKDPNTLKALADYAIARHDPHLTEHPNKYLEFFKAVADRQAALVARWQLVGFIHGVLNTDNVAISGETIDYGPCAFMNAYHLGTVFSSIDHAGRYAYGNQPNITQWNLARFAETLIPLLNPDPNVAVEMVSAELNTFPDRFHRYWLNGMRKKIGLRTEEEADLELVQSLLNWMQASEADFTNTFRDLSEVEPPTGECYQSPEFQAWHSRWRERLVRDGQHAVAAHELMRSVNPAVIPRNHRVEEALAAAEENDDLSVLNELVTVLSTPYDPPANPARYCEPQPNDRTYRTYCGT